MILEGDQEKFFWLSRKVLLLVDNAAGHNIKKETKG